MVLEVGVELKTTTSALQVTHSALPTMPNLPPFAVHHFTLLHAGALKRQTEISPRRRVLFKRTTIIFRPLFLKKLDLSTENHVRISKKFPGPKSSSTIRSFITETHEECDNDITAARQSSSRLWVFAAGTPTRFFYRDHLCGPSGEPTEGCGHLAVRWD